MSKKESDSVLWSRQFITKISANFLITVSLYFLLPLIPVYISERFTDDETLIGLILALFTVSATIIRPITGHFLDTLERKRVGFSGFILFSFTSLCYMVTDSLTAVALFWLLQGLAWGIANTSAAVLIVDIVPESRRGEGIGIWGMTLSLSMALGPLIGLRIEKYLGYTGLFTTSAILGLVAAYLILRLKVPYEIKKKKFNLKELLEPSAFPIALNIILITSTYGSMLVFTGLYFRSLNMNGAGLFFFIFASSIILTRLLTGRIFDKRGPGIILKAGFTVLIAGLVTFSFPVNFSVVIFSSTLLGTGFGLLLPTFQVMANNIAIPEKRGAANSTFFTAFDMGVGLGVVATGIFSKYFGYQVTYRIFAVTIVLSLVLYFTYTSKHYISRLDKTI